MKPERMSGHCAHLELVLSREFRCPSLYYIELPMYDKYSCRRVLGQAPIRLPSESLRADFRESDAHISADFGHSMWGKAFSDHPVVQQALASGENVRPISLYWDGVAYTQRDSFMGFFYEDLLSGKKYLLAVVSPGLRTHASDSAGSLRCVVPCTLLTARPWSSRFRLRSQRRVVQVTFNKLSVPP